MKGPAGRIVAAAVTLAVSAFLIFVALRLVPGDPVAAVTSGQRLTPEQLDGLRSEYGLDEPLLTSFVSWMGGVLHLDFGNSFVYRTSVSDLIVSRLSVSAGLIAYAAVLTVLFGLGLGLFAAARGGIADHGTVVVTSIAVATPAFVTAIILISVFSVRLGWFPALGAGEGFTDRVYHLTLPAIALSFAAFGVMARIARSAFLDEKAREHVEVAESRGIPRRTVMRKHVVRNGLAPVLTVISLLVASLFVGTAVVETAFGIDGVGSLLVQSVARRDLPVVQGIALISVTLFVVTSTVVDLLLPSIDPRLRARSSS